MAEQAFLLAGITIFWQMSPLPPHMTPAAAEGK